MNFTFADVHIPIDYEISLTYPALVFSLITADMNPKARHSGLPGELCFFCGNNLAIVEGA